MLIDTAAPSDNDASATAPLIDPNGAVKLPPLCIYLPGVPDCVPPEGVCLEARCETTGDVTACLIVQVPCAKPVPLHSASDAGALFVACAALAWLALRYRRT